MDDHNEFPFLVAIEIDPQRVRTGSGGRPELLTQGDAEQMLAHLSADIASLLGDIRKCRLAAAGALYDQCQILRPGTPVYAALSRLVGDAHGAASTPGLSAVGFDGESSTDRALQPDMSIPPGLLLLLPLLATGPAHLVDELAGEMEHRFLAEGKVSAHTASWLESAFGIGIGHARLMTLTDLNAMLRMQLEAFGYLPLWTLIDAAVAGAGPEAVTTDNGSCLEWRDGRVHVVFQTFDVWAGNAGRESEALARDYAEWSRELRRYASTLAAHRIPLAFALPEGCAGEVGDHFLYEEVARPQSEGPLASITEHGWPDLGTVAITALMPGVMRHYYPLTPQGLNLIHETLGGLELAGEGLAFPGTIKFNKETRRLRPVAF